MTTLHARTTGPAGRFRTTLFILFWLMFALSGLRPANSVVWALQCVTPVTAALLFFHFRRAFLPSATTSAVLFVQGILLLAGAHFCYQNIPIFRITLPNGLERGYVDWFVHLVDGIAYVFLARDLFRNVLPGMTNAWFRTLSVLCALGLAALWELTEWTAVLASNDLFNMMDGLNIDTYIDMALTLAGALLTVPWLGMIPAESTPAKPSDIPEDCLKKTCVSGFQGSQPLHGRVGPASEKPPVWIQPTGGTRFRPFPRKETEGPDALP